MIVTILLQSEAVALADLQHWLSRQYIVLNPPAKIYNEEGVWNGGYTEEPNCYRTKGHRTSAIYLIPLSVPVEVKSPDNTDWAIDVGADTGYIKAHL